MLIASTASGIPARDTRKARSAVAVLLALVTSSAAAAIVACRDDSPTQPTEARTEIGPEGGTVTAGDVTLTIPAGALAEATDIVITNAPDGPCAANPFFVPGTAHQIGPSGLALRGTATLTIRYDPSNVPAGYFEERLDINDMTAERWHAMTQNRVYPQQYVIEAEIDHFGTYGVTGHDPSEEPVASVVVEPSSLRLGLHEVALLHATVRCEQGLPLERVLSWSSSDEGVATVDGAGLVTGASDGVASITAESEGVSAIAAVAVAGSVTRPGDGGSSETCPAGGIGVSLNQGGLSGAPIVGPLLDTLARGGVSWARIPVAWSRVEPTAGEFHWDEVDALLESVRPHGVEAVLYIAHTPDWAAAVDRMTPRTTALPPDPALWDRFLRLTIRRYHDRVTHWEIWNEPSLGFITSSDEGVCGDGPWCGTPEEYAELLRRSYDVIKDEQPSATVLLGGLVIYGWSREGRFLERVLEAFPSHPLFDVANFHHYGSMDELRDKYSYMETALAAHGRSTRIWLTETGAASGDAPSAVPGYAGEEGQARYLRDVVAASGRLGIDRIAWFKLLDNANANPGFAYHGLFTLDGRAKLSVDTLAAVAHDCPGP